MAKAGFREYEISSQFSWYEFNILDRLWIDFHIRSRPSFNERYLAGILPARRFRLLQIEASPSRDQVITCNLSWYNLDSAPPYTAVSYVWDSDDRTTTIILNGREYKMTVSALTALKGLRSRCSKKKFWIDARSDQRC
jgi:hypothetical protein